MKLLIDLGNSRLKWAIWNGSVLSPAGSIADAECTAQSLADLWRSIPIPDSVWVGSVAAPALDDLVATSLRDARRIGATFVHSVANACGVRNAYPQPRNLGVDRFLGMIAVRGRGGGPCVVVGCGTGLTLDALAADGRHLGGLIAPSPALMQRALRGNAARLGQPVAAPVVEIADDTAVAIESGTQLAAVSLIERFFGTATQRMGARPELILTGGGAIQLAPHLVLPHRIEAELVLQGLARLADSGEWDPTRVDSLK